MQNISNNIVTGLVIIVAALLLYLLFLALRKPVLAKLGVRNIPRRPAQSILIVIGLTLSTIIIVQRAEHWRYAQLFRAAACGRGVWCDRRDYRTTDPLATG